VANRQIVCKTGIKQGFGAENGIAGYLKGAMGRNRTEQDMSAYTLQQKRHQ
jgi:hypothetical protein